MRSILRLSLLAPLWAAALYGSLNIHQANLNLGHSICGAWGCGPPTEALLGYHAFWSVLIFPIIFATALYMNSPSIKKLGWALILVGSIASVVVAGGDTFSYWRSTNSTTYLVQRFFFALVTKIDIPMLQALVGGISLLIGNQVCGLWKAPAEAEMSSPFASETSSA